MLEEIFIQAIDENKEFLKDQLVFQLRQDPIEFCKTFLLPLVLKLKTQEGFLSEAELDSMAKNLQGDIDSSVTGSPKGEEPGGSG